MTEISPIVGKEDMKDDFDADAYHLEQARWHEQAMEAEFKADTYHLKIACWLEQAVAESDAACAWANNYCLKPNIPHLGEKASNIYSHNYAALFQFPDEICRLAIKSWWIAQRQWQLERDDYMATQEVIEGAENEYLPEKLEDFQNHAIDGDRGEAFYFFLGRNSFIATEHFWNALKPYRLYLSKPPQGVARLLLSNPQVPDNDETGSSQNRQALLKGIALHWFCEADDLMAAGKTLGALDAMSDAFSVLLYLSFEEACQGSYDKGVFNISQKASNSAKLRHAQTYKKADMIKNYWRKNIGPYQSNEFAAELLQKEFPDMAHRTLAKYVSQAKKEMKKLPPASTA